MIERLPAVVVPLFPSPLQKVCVFAGLDGNQTDVPSILDREFPGGGGNALLLAPPENPILSPHTYYAASDDPSDSPLIRLGAMTVAGITAEALRRSWELEKEVPPGIVD